MRLNELKLFEQHVHISEFTDAYYDRVKNELRDSCPEVVGAVYLNSSGITSLKNCPRVVHSTFNLNDTKLTSAIGGPEKVGNYVSGPITSLEGLPRVIENELDLTGSAITSLEGIHRHVKQLGTDGASTGDLIVRGEQIKAGGLGLLLIDGFFRVKAWRRPGALKSRFGKACDIINPYIEHNNGRKNLVECHERLLDAGLDEFAEI